MSHKEVIRSLLFDDSAICTRKSLLSTKRADGQGCRRGMGGSLPVAARRRGVHRKGRTRRFIRLRPSGCHKDDDGQMQVSQINSWFVYKCLGTFYKYDQFFLRKPLQAFKREYQCWGSVTFWCGSGSLDPYLWLMDPDPPPFFSEDAKQNYFFLHIFFW